MDNCGQYWGIINGTMDNCGQYWGVINGAMDNYGQYWGVINGTMDTPMDNIGGAPGCVDKQGCPRVRVFAGDLQESPVGNKSESDSDLFPTDPGQIKSNHRCLMVIQSKIPPW